MSIIKANYITLLLVSAISILTEPNTLTVLLEYSKHFDLNPNGNIKQMLGRKSLSIALPHIKPT